MHTITRARMTAGTIRDSFHVESVLQGADDGRRPKTACMGDPPRLACVWDCATSVEEAVEITAKRLGHMCGWKIGPDLDLQVFAAMERGKEAGKPFWSPGRSQETSSGASQAFHFCGTICGTNSITYWFYLFICGRRLHQRSDARGRIRPVRLSALPCSIGRSSATTFRLRR